MLAALLLSCLLGFALSADILAVFSHPSRSHYNAFEPLVLELAARGHQLTVISYFPQKTPVANYTDISLEGQTRTIRFKDISKSTVFTEWKRVTDFGMLICETVLATQQVKDLIGSRKKFDLVIVEMFNTDCFLSVVKSFGAPHIGLSSSMSLPHHNARVANPDSFSHVSNMFLPYSRYMSFSERFWNVLVTLVMRLILAFHYRPIEHNIVSKTLGRDVDLQGVAHEVSLVLMSSHYSIHGSRALVPGYVEIGGLHIHPANPLEKELDKFLNESKEGALLFSMGSVLQSSSFPAEKRQAFMDAFAELPVRVIMKWENDTLPGKPDNVRLSKWLPQRDIMAHPKVVAFMGHGGLLSTSEAVYCGLPMVLIPMFGDQPNNVAHLAATGAAVRLPFQDISKDTVLQALRAVLFDARYKENAHKLSEQYRDRPMSPLDTAVYWTEYVLRHKGAPHLRSAAVDMPWYQLWLLDVIAALLTASIITLLLVLYLAKRITSVVSQMLNRNKHKKD